MANQPMTDFRLFSEFPDEVKLKVWHNSQGDRVLSVTRERHFHAATFTLVDVLRVRESAPVGTLRANYQSREVALEQYPLAFGTNTTHLGAAGARLDPNTYPARTRFSAAHDIVFIDDFANTGLTEIAQAIKTQDRSAIQRLAMPINATDDRDIDGFVAQLHFFPSLRELILVVDHDATSIRYPSQEGFAAITAPWNAAIQQYYNTTPVAPRPMVRFEVPGWRARAPEPASSEERDFFLQVSVLNHHESPREYGRRDSREGGGVSGVQSHFGSM
jgi:hypothetical protein